MLYEVITASNHVIDNISITNSTFYNIGRLFLHNKSNSNSVLIADCTFDDIIAAGRYFFDYSSSYGPTNGFTLSNCIFGDTRITSYNVCYTKLLRSKLR